MIKVDRLPVGCPCTHGGSSQQSMCLIKVDRLPFVCPCTHVCLFIISAVRGHTCTQLLHSQPHCARQVPHTVHTHTRTHTRAHTHTYTHIHARTHTCAHTHTHNTHTHTHTEVTLKGSTTHKSVSVPPSTLLPPGAVSHVSVTFQPLLVGSTNTTLKLECTELGLYEWDVELQVCVCACACVRACV